MQPAQGGALISNIPHNLTESGRTIATMVRHAADNGHRQIEVAKQAEGAWLDLLLSAPARGSGVIGSPDCTPGYYNNEGRPGGVGSETFVGYPEGPAAFFEYLDGWRGSGEFDGIEFR